MTTKDAKEYMSKLEIPQLFESMLTGLLYNKPKDHLQFLGECINSAKTNPNIKWDTFLDLNKKPLPAIPKTTDGPIRSESYSLQEPSLEQKTFPTEPVLEMKIQTKLPAIKKGNGNSMDSVDSLDGDVTTEKHISTNGGDDDMPFQLKQFEKQRVIFVLGGPGSGKGTQCARIVQKFGYTHLSAGDLLRDEVKKNSERATMIAELIKEGKLVPQEVTIELLRDAMRQYPQSPGFLIDGFPREIGQGHQFENEVAECDLVLFFECSEQAMEERLIKRGETSGRTDDNAETIKKRFRTFVEKTMPVVEYYESLNKLRKIDACRHVDEVFELVCGIFNEIPTLPMAKRIEQIENLPTKDTVGECFSGQRIFFVLGGPGSGKGTQCEKIVEKFGYTHLSTGDLLRDEVKKDTERARLMNEIMKEGKLVPQEIIVQLLRDAMLENPKSPGFLIDGFPRELGQAKQFEDELVECDQVLFFECSEEVMEERLLKRGETSGRTDDNSETIKKRFKTYIEKTLPVIEYYGNLNKVKKIDATRDVDIVFSDVCQMFGVMSGFPVAKRHKTKGQRVSHAERTVSDEALKTAVNDIFAHIERSEKQQEDKSENKEKEEHQANKEELRTPVEEPIITPEEVPLLGDLGTAKLSGKGLLDVRVIFVIGGPGCGKGTQCAKIVETFGFTHLSTGDLLRSEVTSGSTRGQTLSAIMERGELVPMETILEIVRDALIKRPDTKDFLIDGFPRELNQAVQFEKEIAVCECVLYFECSAETMTARLLKRGETSGRVDDNEATIKNRLETFFSQTIPVIEYYKEREKIHTISAETNPEEIFREVKTILDSLPSRSTTALRQLDIIFISGHRSNDTQVGQQLADNNGRTVLSVSDLLKKQSENESEGQPDVNQQPKEVSNENILKVLFEKLMNETNPRGYVIVGLPKTVDQLEQFQKFSQFRFVLYLESESDEAEEQATGEQIEEDGGGETDLKERGEQTERLLEKLEALGKLKKIPASLTVEEVISTAQTYIDSLE